MTLAMGALFLSIFCDGLGPDYSYYAPPLPLSASSRMDDFHVYYCSRPNLGYVRVGRELPRPVATRSYTLPAGALQTGRPVTYTLTLSLFA
jgi:hypothetical protein